jgi:hypothetical protein
MWYPLLLPASEILSLLRSDPDIQSYILNNFTTAYNLAKVFESIRDRVERMRYITLIDPDKVIDALLVVKEDGLKDIVPGLTEKPRQEVLK